MEDKQVQDLIIQEERRLQETLMLIPSENYASQAVREALGSVFTDKYSEGYPKKRYYQGNAAVDDLESLTRERAKKLFGVPFVNVQPYSGSPANLAILSALCMPGETILSQHLSMGGHLSMGQEASMTGKFFKAEYYGLTRDGEIDWRELEKKAKTAKPKVIFCGGTAYTRIFDFDRYAQIASEVGAYFVADISHIAGLVAGGAHPSPVGAADVVMTTTHKTLRGPRGAMIMVTEKGITKEALLPEKIDKAVFPGLQGGPHNNNIAGIAVALGEAMEEDFAKYARQIVLNSQALASALKKEGWILIGGGSENHMIWIDLRNKGIDGWTMAWAMEAAGIVANRQTIPFDERPPYYPSGLRLGTPAVTTRGMKEPEMELIAGLMKEVLAGIRKMDLTGIGNDDREIDQKARGAFKKQVFKEKVLLAICEQVRKLGESFPVEGK